MSAIKIKNDINLLTGLSSPAGTIIQVGKSLLRSGVIDDLPTIDEKRYDLSAQIGGLVDVMDQILIEQSISRGGDPLLLTGKDNRGLQLHPDIRLRLRSSYAKLVLRSHRGARPVLISGRPSVEDLIRYKLYSLQLKGLGWILPNTGTRGSRAMLSVQRSIPVFLSSQLERNSDGTGFVFASGQMTPILKDYRRLLTGEETSREPILCTGKQGSKVYEQCLRDALSRSIEAKMVQQL